MKYDSMKKIDDKIKFLKLVIDGGNIMLNHLDTNDSDYQSTLDLNKKVNGKLEGLITKKKMTIRYNKLKSIRNKIKKIC